ncbi:MAG: hypothetical protein JXR63_08310 [Spirochaetales bacterium]|nr:hypothetical protein [Spirochaetales bacterium]
MKQHTLPIIIKDNQASSLQKVELGSREYDEAWIQGICFENPGVLPFVELEPVFEGMVPVCRELATKAGPADLVFVNAYGFIAIGECKLWRNPEARRKAVGQVLDYAKELAKWDYSTFEAECLKSRKSREKTLFELMQEENPEVDEAFFIDSVERNLRRGRFLLLIIGDGIRENMEELAEFLQANGNLNFPLGLVELPVYKNPLGGELLITPRILAKTKEIQRLVYRFADDSQVAQAEQVQAQAVSQTISENVFYEKLQNSIPAGKVTELQQFIASLTAEFNLFPKLGRGKRLSLNLKSPDDIYNFASIQETGEVWFYGIVVKTDQLGAKAIGTEYLASLATLVGAQLDTSSKEWNWSVKRAGKYLSITDYLQVKEQWAQLIGGTLGRIVEEL